MGMFRQLSGEFTRTCRFFSLLSTFFPKVTGWRHARLQESSHHWNCRYRPGRLPSFSGINENRFLLRRSTMVASCFFYLNHKSMDGWILPAGMLWLIPEFLLIGVSVNCSHWKTQTGAFVFSPFWAFPFVYVTSLGAFRWTFFSFKIGKSWDVVSWRHSILGVPLRWKNMIC